MLHPGYLFDCLLELPVMNNVLTNETCPCGSGKAYAACCGPVHDGSPAPTAEALMRSRYSAFALGNSAYLLKSWHSRTRPSRLDLSDGVVWTGLTVGRSESGGADDKTGLVEFIASYRGPEGEGQVREISRFQREGGWWVYRDAQPGTGMAPSRNAPCPCGSGKKYKRCCGS